MPELEFHSAEGWVKCSTDSCKVRIACSLVLGMIRISMICSLMAGAIMDRSEKGEILQQTLPTEK